MQQERAGIQTPQPVIRLRQRIFGGILAAYIAACFRLLPFLTRLGPFGIILAFLLLIGSIALFVMVLLGLLFLQARFEVTPAGQFVSLALTIGGALFAVYLWVGRQAQTTWGAIRLILLALGLAALAVLVWNSGFFHEARLNYMRARFEADPVYYLSRVYVLISMVVTGVLGAVLASQRFVRRAYRSPLHFVLAVVRLSVMVLVVIGIVSLVLSSGYLDDMRANLDEALNPAWLMEQYGSGGR
jgi:glucan phosphoethanolaminetransferase (alkaline phosphatase superfamily)